MIVKKGWFLAILAMLGLTACSTFKMDIKAPPLPNDINIIPPSPDLPKGIAAFLGKWKGTWPGGLKTIVVIEEINDTSAQLLFSWGDHPSQGLKAGYIRQACKVIPDPNPQIVTDAPPLFKMATHTWMARIRTWDNFMAYEGRLELEITGLNTVEGRFYGMPSNAIQFSPFLLRTRMERSK